MGPYAQAYCEILGGYGFLSARYPCKFFATRERAKCLTHVIHRRKSLQECLTHNKTHFSRTPPQGYA